MPISNQLYDRLKWWVTVFLPALAVFWQTVGEIYHWPHATQCTASLNALTVFLGALIQVSSHHYHQGGPHHA